MMALVYALLSPKGCSWHVSLDMRADRDHWVGLYGSRFKLRVLEPALSFGQAQELVQHVSHSSIKGKLEEMLYSGGREIGMAREKLKEWRLREWKPSKLECASIDGNTEIGQLLTAMSASLEGRFLLVEEFKAFMQNQGEAQLAEEPGYFLQSAWLQGRIVLEAGVEKRKSGGGLLSLLHGSTRGRCRRCGSEGAQRHAKREGIIPKSDGETDSVVWTDCPYCAGPCPYCEACLTMGRVRYCTPLIRSGIWNGLQEKGEMAQEPDRHALLSPWGLSEVQAEASGLALDFLKANKSLSRKNENGRSANKFLIWAVTGAGKTEMIFPMIQYTLACGGKVAVATPRRDVVLELKPRLEKAFPSARVVTLYGGSEQRWEQGELTLATTHQLMRFHQAFELVIVDELDAFPYHNNPQLQYAAEQVCKPDGAYILLSATPPAELQRAVRKGALPHARVAARYHRHPLPVPSLLGCPALRQTLQQGVLPGKLKHKLQAALDRGAQIFVFVPKIAMVEPFTELLRRVFHDVHIQGTSSKDADRAGKVTDFRAAKIRMLVTTTILERGVTIPKSDVFILDADSPVFDAAALVQMAGRAGRSAQDPKGFVVFAAREKTRSQVQAVKQIVDMNKLALKKGYIDSWEGLPVVED